MFLQCSFCQVSAPIREQPAAMLDRARDCHMRVGCSLRCCGEALDFPPDRAPAHATAGGGVAAAAADAASRRRGNSDAVGREAGLIEGAYICALLVSDPWDTARSQGMSHPLRRSRMPFSAGSA